MTAGVEDFVVGQCAACQFAQQVFQLRARDLAGVVFEGVYNSSAVRVEGQGMEVANVAA